MPSSATDDTKKNTPLACHHLTNSTRLPSRHTSPNNEKIKKPKLTNTGLSRINQIFICICFHLPWICLLRPLSVPRTLPHPLQIRFQRWHTPRGEKPGEQLGFRGETQEGGPVTATTDCQSWAFPQHLFSNSIWYRSTKSKLTVLKNRLLSVSFSNFSRNTKSCSVTMVEMAISLPICI